MTYAYYQQVKGGKSPKTAPTYVQDEPATTPQATAKYVCSVCGYVYDEPWATRITALRPEQSLKICRNHGYVLCAAQRNQSLKRNSKLVYTVIYGLCL